MAQLEREHPDAAKFWKQPEALKELEEPQLPLGTRLYESWQKSAQMLLANLLKQSNAFVFKEPVDPIALNIPEYPTIIKRPMDFRTVGLKLQRNVYASL